MKAGWSEVELGDVAEIKLGRQRSPKNHVGDKMRPYIRAANIGWAGLKLDDVKQMQFTDAEMVVYRLRRGDLLLGEASGSQSEVGKPAIWNEEIPDCAFQNTLIRVRSAGPDPRYLLHFFKYQASSGEFARRSRGVGIFHLGRKVVAETPVPLPPIEEQRRIAAVLDAADGLRAKRRQAIAKFDTLTQAIFIDMFGDPKKLSRWEIETVESVAHSRKGSIRTGPFGSQLLHDEFVESGVAVLGIDNVVQNRFIPPDKRFITEKKYEELARYKVLAGDVLVTIMGTCGRVAVVPDDVPLAINTKHLCCISPDLEKISPVFLGATLRFDRGVLRQLGATRGAVMPGLNMGLIKHAEFPLPPMGLQHDFERAVSQVSGEQQRAVESLGDMDGLFASLQQQAFRGEL